jgi:thymidylate synthase
VSYVIDHPGHEISPLIVSITGFDKDGLISEDATVRVKLDTLLAETEKWDVETVAFTIFPESLREIAGSDRAVLFKLFRDSFPRYQAMSRITNRRGWYFERLTMYGGGPNDGNQLEYIITEYKRRPSVRRSMLQASIFDPARDHVRDAQLVFPCLQHVSFVPVGHSLIVNAFYATQQLFDKAYGNYLGLSRLGRFMAAEMGLTMARLNVFIGVAKLERINKTDSRLRAIVDSVTESAE